jgi:RNA polymerase sigma-70 factor (ECF subfamily)
MADAPDSERWANAYRAAYPSVYRALVATLLDQDGAADALHEAFVEALRRPPRTEDNIAGWLFRVALRKARRDRRRLGRILAGLFAGWTEPRGVDVLDHVLDRISIGELLRLLTERQRAIVVAYYYLDLTQQDIAELFGIRRGTVAATLAHALARMRQGGIHVV